MPDEKTSHIPEEWLVPTVASEDAMADSLGSYRLCFEVASGGMATVYLALYEGAFGFEKVVALKKIHKHLARERQFVDMFFDEARIAAHIDHPFVCKVVDFGHAQESYYLAMEYLVGEPLSAVWEALERHPALAASPDLPRVVVRVIADLAEGLHAAHELTDDGESIGLVHRDVTPANLFVLYDGTVRVVDFGIAKAKNRISHTETGHVKGKYAYVSPEQLRMKPVDRRCDIWALGVVLWEMLTVRRLFKRENPVDTIAAVTSGKIVPPSSVRPDIPPALDQIVLKALSRRPEGRYRTARELAVALESWLATTGRAVARAELAEWLETLFPGAHDRKRKLMELTRRGESAIPIGERGGDDEETTHVAVQAPTTVFEPERVGRRSGPGRRAVAEPTTEVGEDELEPVADLRADDRTPESDSAPEPDDAAGVGAEEGPDDDGPAAKLRVDEEDRRPRRRSASRTPMILAAVAVIGIGAGIAALADRDGTPAGAPRDVPSEVTDRGGDGMGEAAGTGGLADLAQQLEETETWPPWAGEGEAGASGGTGEVYLTTRGGWADVYLEGRRVGRTPQELRLPAGRHSIVLRPYGDGEERRMEVEVRAGRRVYLDTAIPTR